MESIEELQDRINELEEEIDELKKGKQYLQHTKQGRAWRNNWTRKNRERMNIPHLKSKYIKAGFNKEGFAEALGVHRNTIYNWEIGISNPTLPQAKKIAELLKCTIDELLED